MTDTAVVVIGESSVPVLLEHRPALVLAEAQEAARALKDVIGQKPKKLMFNKKQYLEFEDWQTVGRFYGITGGLEGELEFVTLGAAQGFKATCVAWDRTGRVVSRATAYCLSDEDKWGSRPKYEYQLILKSGELVSEADAPSDKSLWLWEPNPNKPGGQRPKKQQVKVGEETVPLYQLASMAQTRANAKALRNVLSYVTVLAGYAATPAEEMPSDAFDSAHAPTTSEREPGDESVIPHTDEYGVPIEVRATAAGAQPNPAYAGGMPACPVCGRSKGVMASKKKEGSFYCKGCAQGFDAASAGPR